MAAETKTRRWWASIGAGALLCLGCCAVPLLIAAGVLGGGTLLVSLSWLEPLGFALIGLGVVGLIWSRWRARTRGCGDGCASTTASDEQGTPARACGCASTAA
ncbi:hypothetical protein ACWDOP_00360 [Nocardia sp. NPDC003693]